jgi:hypothetical protein
LRGRRQLDRQQNCGDGKSSHRSQYRTSTD